MYFGEVISICLKDIPSGFLKVETFEDGRIKRRGKAFFFVRDGQMFVPSKKSRPEFSGIPGEIRTPRVGDTFMFDGIEIYDGFFVVAGYGYYRQWRYIRDKMRGKKRESYRKALARVGYEQLVPV